ncbi:MAG TPA: MFS transporter [Candidatus Sulfotelmatobacter sp.]|nr:MFS transporter [Candidatus Sulfotelmatobacter sp.]
MSWLANVDVNRLTVHTTLHQFAYGISGVFAGAYLLRAGLSPAAVFLTLAAILTLRFVLRPLVLVAVARLGPRLTLIGGTLLVALQYPLLATVRGTGIELAVYCGVTALGNVFYWTCYHAFFAALGDAEGRGRQVGAREVMSAVAGVLAPAAGGLLLTNLGPWTAFGAAGLFELTAIAPLLRVREPTVAAVAPPRAYEAARLGTFLFVCDGWMTSSAAVAWTIILFRALGARYDAFGGALAAAALAGALAGMLLGHVLDRGHARRAILINAGLFASSLLFKIFCGSAPLAVLVATVIGTVLAGLYIPSLMTAVYNEGKAAPCTLRFQFAAEGGWDVGGTLACFAAAALCWTGAPLQSAIVLALPVVFVQARLLVDSYGARALGATR